ncbi:hypothetical protein L1787_20985 [Acuticoccus sp. M5D2P5]|uniref:hypothetical protein n=1 Tax=Acuticoccus kalidii TaxID=2910977 RepID=UPI001F477713|nr:hypothetical protein [Acuticoccus kalidii]MCF3935868.1 hypothetical protein [Acuticoccus kalidii]
MAAILAPSGASSQGLNAALIDETLIERLRDHLAMEIVWRSVSNQNRMREDASQSDIDRLDEQWRSERDAEAKPLIAATLASPLSNYLTRIQALSLGLYCEIIVMDANGLNVGQSNITSDYWQGDEAKWQKTYGAGKSGQFIDAAEWNDETKTWRTQVNLTIDDPDTGEPIGAATFEINLTELQRREHVQ